MIVVSVCVRARVRVLARVSVRGSRVSRVSCAGVAVFSLRRVGLVLQTTYKMTSRYCFLSPKFTRAQRAPSLVE